MFIVDATLLAQQHDMCCDMACTAWVVFANVLLWYMQMGLKMQFFGPEQIGTAIP